MKHYAFEGRTALVTGAGGGIGRAIACSLSRRGCNLALADIDEAGLAQTVEGLDPGVRASRHKLDVGDANAIENFPAIVEAEHGRLDILVNNAGVALGGTFEEISATDFEWLFAINFWGVVRMTRAFLPLLKHSNDGRLVNLSSLFGLIAPPGQTAYAASKFAVRGFSEALRKELAGTSLGVTVAHPGGVATAIAQSARRALTVSPDEERTQKERFQRLLKLPPERAGRSSSKPSPIGGTGYSSGLTRSSQRWSSGWHRCATGR
jgi:NAD(P)-dependent dehydrogenase (short-subunit alcohol dehydrogenase family)